MAANAMELRVVIETEKGDVVVSDWFRPDYSARDAILHHCGSYVEDGSGNLSGVQLMSPGYGFGRNYIQARPILNRCVGCGGFVGCGRRSDSFVCDGCYATRASAGRCRQCGDPVEGPAAACGVCEVVNRVRPKL